MSALLTTPSPPAQHGLGQYLGNLVDRPVLLLLVLLAANALARPYANLDHDARLYSVQVLNQAEYGSYKDDLFFRYGSQDHFSLFSALLAPLVRGLGLELTFFLVYLAATTLLIAALIRLVRRLIDDRFLALLTLLYLAVGPLNYGGQGILQVHEQFLTPRLLAVGLVLFGMEQLLQGRRWTSLLLLVAAGLLHPLMAAGGFLTWGGVFLVDKLGWRRAALVAGGLSLVGAVVLAIPSLAGRFLGHMDETWRDAIHNACSYIFPAEWELRDWINILVCWLGLAAGVWLYHKEKPRLAQFCAVVFLVGVAAVASTILAPFLPYALLLQGQAYRALWLLKVLQVPLCFLLADRLLRSRKIGPQALAVPLLGFFVFSTSQPREWGMPLVFLPIAIVFYRGLKPQPQRPDWLLRSAVVSVVLGQICWTLFRETLCFLYRSELLAYWDHIEYLRMLIGNVGVLVWMVLILGLVLWFSRMGASARSLGLTCLAIVVGVQLAAFALPSTAYAREHASQDLSDVLFVRQFLRNQQAQGDMRLTIYSAYGRVDYVWLELQANNYFDWWPSGGFVFQRQTAMEGQRRALLAGPFEVARLSDLQAFLADHVRRDVRRFFQRELDDPGPTVADLARLCQDEHLDYALLKQEFPGLYSASNGRVFLYNCQHVRTALKQSPPETAAASVEKR